MNGLRLITLGLIILLAITGCQTKQPDTVAMAWEAYEQRSDQWRQLDRAFIQTELDRLGLEQTQLPKRAKRFGFDPNKSLDWYSTQEGQSVADALVSFQTPSGGWSKRTDMGVIRQPGQAFGVESHYIPTFDNGATTTQLRILAKAYTATQKPAYANAFYKGVNLIFEAQYPNGGWPQTYPLVGSYHDHITFNDDVMVNIARLLRHIAQGEDEYAFVSEKIRDKARLRLSRAIELILETQVKVDGKPSLWAGQYEARSLKPAPARAYEMVALATSESADLLNFLMQLQAPSPDTVAAVHAGINWYSRHKIVGYTWHSGDTKLTQDPEAPPIWPRFVEIGTNRPLFGDRDGSIHHHIAEVSRERRNSYGWYTHSPSEILKRYADWRGNHPKADNP